MQDIVTNKHNRRKEIRLQLQIPASPEIWSLYVFWCLNIYKPTRKFKSCFPFTTARIYGWNVLLLQKYPVLALSSYLNPDKQHICHPFSVWSKKTLYWRQKWCRDPDHMPPQIFFVPFLILPQCLLYSWHITWHLLDFQKQFSILKNKFCL